MNVVNVTLVIHKVRKHVKQKQLVETDTFNFVSRKQKKLKMQETKISASVF